MEQDLLTGDTVTSTDVGQNGEASGQKSSCPFFCNGALFDPKNLNPKVVELIYWRDPKKTGPVFGAGLVLLLSLCVWTLLTVVSYLSLLGLGVAIAFRVYKNVITAVQKTQDGHPFKDYLEKDIAITKARGHHLIDTVLGHVNSVVAELRRLFLVEDLVDSIKFALLLWGASYIGCWFNGLTLVILTYLSVFSLPIVYEQHKEKIDVYFKLAHDKVNEVVTMVKSKLPGFKPKEQ